MKKDFEFIDLFAGIGGFHIAMTNLGGKCVLASEIDEFAIQTYKENYGIDSNHDITQIKDIDVPKHDVLCGGFPCQPFSKAGTQDGFGDPTKGTLFFQICRILKAKRPKYIFLENVRNLVSHDNGNTWNVIKQSLENLGYILTEKPIIMSPNQLGVPQLRERVYILGIHKSTGVKKLEISLPPKLDKKLDIYKSSILETGEVDKKYYISKHEEYVLTAWDEFYKGIKEKVLGFPVWAFEFKKTYDYNTEEFPAWKQNFIKKNRLLYENNKNFIDSWLIKYDNLKDFTPTQQKFEWQAGTSINTLWEGFIQFRPSGIRVKKPDSFPALVAMVQIPIIGRYRRRLTPREAARLQSFPDSFIPNANDQQAYKQFGNAVNINCVQFLAEQLLKY